LPAGDSFAVLAGGNGITGLATLVRGTGSDLYRCTVDARRAAYDECGTSGVGRVTDDVKRRDQLI
jgi:hypothetical protein